MKICDNGAKVFDINNFAQLLGVHPSDLSRGCINLIEALMCELR